MKLFPVLMVVLINLLLFGLFSLSSLDSALKYLQELRQKEVITPAKFMQTELVFKYPGTEATPTADVLLPLAKLPDNFVSDVLEKAKLLVSNEDRYKLLNFAATEVSVPQTTFAGGYANLINTNVPIFISSDAVLHYLNAQSNLIYQNLVVEKLRPLLGEILDKLIIVHQSWQDAGRYSDKRADLTSNLGYFQNAKLLLDDNSDKYGSYQKTKNFLAEFNGKNISGSWNNQAELMAAGLKETGIVALWRKFYAVENFFTWNGSNQIVENDSGVEIMPYQKTDDSGFSTQTEQDFLDSLTACAQKENQNFFTLSAKEMQLGVIEPVKVFNYQKTAQGEYLNQKTALAFLEEQNLQLTYLEVWDALQSVPSNEVYIQPEARLYSFLKTFVEYTSKGLADLQLNTTYGSAAFAEEINILEIFKLISSQELATQMLSTTEHALVRTFLNNLAALRSTQDQVLEANYLVTVVKSPSNSEDKVYLGMVYDQMLSVAAWLDFSVNTTNFNQEYDVSPIAQAKGTVRIPVLMYHNIGAQPNNIHTRHLYVTPEMFEQQMAYLVRKNYHSLTPAEFYELLKSGKNPEQKSVMITFDDGTYGHYQYAFPILKKYGMVGVFYVVSSKSGISRAKMREMAAAGMVIDSHTATHMDLTKISDEATFANEISGSRYALQAATGKQVVSIAYPGCVAKSKAIAWTQSSGYLLGFSCGKSIDHRLSQRFVLSRLHVYNNFDNFVRRLSGYYEIPASY